MVRHKEPPEHAPDWASSQANIYTPTPCISVYLDPNWTRAKSSSSSDSSSLLPWVISDRAWNRNDKGLSRWGEKTGGERRMKGMMACTREDGGGHKKIKVDSFKKSQEDKDDGILGVCMLEAYFWCCCRFWKIHYCHFVCSFNLLSEFFLNCELNWLSQSVKRAPIHRGAGHIFVCLTIQKQFSTNRITIQHQ